MLPDRSERPVDLVVTEDQVPDPNGLCFSPDYKKLYVASTGKGPGDTGPGGKGDIYVFDVGDDNKLSNHEALHATAWSTASSAGRTASAATSTAISGPQQRRAAPSATAASSSGMPEGKLIGRIRLPEICGNVSFGGPKRNRLFMAGSQSLYAVYVAPRVPRPARPRPATI